MMMTRGKRSALATALMLVISGCDTASSGGDGGGPAAPTGTVEFSQANFEVEAKFVGPRMHALVSEVYRNLELIHLSLNLFYGSSIEAKMADACGSGGCVIDDLLTVAFNDASVIAPDASGNPFAVEGCDNLAGITTKFIDLDATDSFTPGDQILRDYDNFSCDYDFFDGSGNPLVTDTSRPAYWPSQSTGNILYEFTGGGAGSFQGTATFGDPTNNTLNYDTTGGLLSSSDAESESYNGTVTFDIDFNTRNATFTDISVSLNNGTASLTSPATLTIASLSRQVNVAGSDIVTITDGSIVSDVSGQGFTFSTQPFNPPNTAALTGTTGLLPEAGAIVMEGENDTAVRVRTEFLGGPGIVELDLDGDDQFNDGQQAEPNGWGWFVYGFLMAEKAPQPDN